MAPGSQIGGAKVVDANGNDIQSDMKTKVNSHIRAYAKNLADLNSYPAAVARGMVDTEVDIVETNDSQRQYLSSDDLSEIPDPKPHVVHTLKKKGEILTLTAVEARECGIASGIANDTDEVLNGSISNPIPST